MNEIVVATAAIIQNDSGILICKRRDGDNFGGLWEFPGGKLEWGESPIECLKREIKEELDIEVFDLKLYDIVSMPYPNGHHVILIFYTVGSFEGNPKQIECSEFIWAKKNDLENLDFLKADEGISKKLAKSI